MKRLPRVYVYLLLSGGRQGKVYIGMTGDLRRRFKEHNSRANTGYTRGKRWHLLAVRMFLDRGSAAKVEAELKAYHRGKGNWRLDRWIRHERPRLRRLCDRHGIRHRLV